MTQVNAGILGTGHSYPEMVLTNADLEKIVDTSDEWITSRTGIKQRHKAASGEYTSQFASRASQEAIERAGIDPNEIDLILCATVTPDQILPSTACLIQAQLGANKAAAMDILPMESHARQFEAEVSFVTDSCGSERASATSFWTSLP